MKEDLLICPKCGWYDGYTHGRKCDPAMGRAANRLAAELAPIPSTKLGYGYGRLTFEIGDTCHVTIAADSSGRHSIDNIWVLRTRQPQLAAIVRAMAQIFIPEVVGARVDMPVPLTQEELAAAQGLPSYQKVHVDLVLGENMERIGDLQGKRVRSAEIIDGASDHGPEQQVQVVFEDGSTLLVSAGGGSA